MCSHCATIGAATASAGAATETINSKDLNAEQFAERLVNTLNEASIALMLSIGHRTGLFDVMARLKPATSRQIADQAGLNERYVREWLGAMTTARIVNYHPAEQTYHLPAQHAAFLTRDAVPENMAGFCQWIAVLGGVEDQVVEAFRHGRGVPYDAYRRFHEVMAEESAQTVVAGLDEYVIPLVEGLREQLESGIDVLDIGCGSGRAMNHLAERYPQSRFIGYDISEQAIAAARKQSVDRGLNNTRFEPCDVSEMTGTDAFDLICAFDAIHDQAKPAQVLVNIRRALRNGGVLLMQDIAASSHVHENMDHPVAPMLYTISCMHCMSVSLANGGPGLGAVWGRQKALEMLDEAGFDNVRVEQLDHDFQNFYYIATKAS